MNYNLTIVNNNYQKINLETIIPTKKDLFDLKHIDNLTMKFGNELELKRYLLAKGLIDITDFEKKLCVSYGKKNKRHIPILYENDKDIIDKLREFAEEIKKYFIERKKTSYSNLSYSLIMRDYDDIINFFPSFEIFAGNHKFLIELQKYISNNPKQNLNINDINIYINQLSDDKKSKVIYIALFEIFRRLFYNYNKETAELEFNYKGFRDFCVFYCSYKKKIEREKNPTKEADLREEDIFGSDEEPDFPPNSEEEAKYAAYQDRLDELSEQNIDPYNEFYGPKKR